MFAKINEFALRNFNKTVFIETRTGKYVGTLTDCDVDKYIELKESIGTRCIPMSNIINYCIIKNEYDSEKENNKLRDETGKKILADLAGCSPNDSMHDIAVRLLFGTKVKPEFNYKDISKESKMSPERFKELLDELDGNSLNTLKEKNARYATDGDCLHNFRSGAEIAGKSMAETCWGYMTKHLTALRDMVMKNDFSNREDFLEKCQDTINYIRFLWCIGNDASNSEVNNTPVDKFVEYCKTDVEATMELYQRFKGIAHICCVDGRIAYVGDIVAVEYGNEDKFITGRIMYITDEAFGIKDESTNIWHEFCEGKIYMVKSLSFK